MAVIQPLSGSTGTSKPISSGRGVIAPLAPLTNPILERKTQQQAPQVGQVNISQPQGIVEGVKKIAARTAVSFADLVSEGLDFTTNFIANNPIFIGKALTNAPKAIVEAGLEKIAPKKDIISKTKRELENKWKEVYSQALATGNVPTKILKQNVDKIQQTEYIKPSKEWEKASLKDKLTKNLGETLAVLGPNIIPSFVLYAVNPVVGAGVTITSTANDIKESAIENGVDNDKAELLSLGTGILIGALDRIVPDELFSGKQKASFISNFTKRVVLTSLKEGGTEVAQEDLQIAAEATFRKDLGFDEVLTRNIMSGLGGLLGGSGASMVMGTINNSFNQDILAEPQQKPQEQQIKPDETQPQQVIQPLTQENPEIVKVSESPVVGQKLKVVEQKAVEPTQPKGVGGVKTIYHGTTPEVVKVIENNGFDVKKSADGTIWFTDNKEMIQSGKVAASGKGGIVERTINESKLKLGGWNEMDKYSTDELINMGYDGLKLKDEGETTYQIFFPEKLQLPTQTKGVGGVPKNVEIRKMESINDIKEIIQPLTEGGKKIGIPPESKVYLVGSRASGKAKLTSDYDLVIEGLTKEQRIRSDKIFNFYNKDRIHAPSSKVDKSLPHKFLGTFGELSTQTKGVEVKPVEVVKPKEVKVAPNTLPIGEGKVKASRLEARMKGVLGKADQETIDKLGLSTFNEMNRKDTISKAVDYVTKNPDEALKVLTGEIPAPKGLNSNAVYVALDQQAIGDPNLQLKLASVKSSAMGQNLNILKELNPDSPVKYMSDIIKLREEAFTKKYKGKTVKQATDQVVRDIRKSVKVPDKQQWADFLKSIEC